MDLWYWLIGHDVFSHKTDKKSTAVLFDLYTKKMSQTNERKVMSDCGKRPVNHFPDSSQFAEAEPFEWRNSQVFVKIPKFYC